jgi:uncharacterized membrane protein
MAVLSVALALFSIRLDETYRDEALREQGWIYSGGAEGARAVLSAIAGSIITVAGTTFSITIAVLSLASAQFGPRLLRNFMRDTGNQVVLGTFTSTFLYCLLVLRTVRGLDNDTYVPHISVTIGVGLAVTSLGVLIYFIHHVAESIQVAHVVEVVSAELYEAVERLFPDRVAQPDEPEESTLTTGTNVCIKREGYLQAIDHMSLLRFADRRNLQMKVLCRPGDYVMRGTAVVLASPHLAEEDAGAIQSAFTVGRTRTPHQDAVFAFLQLTEIAVRALSPGVNDPFTAMMCLDRITSGMMRLTTRSLPESAQRGPSGTVRIIVSPYDYGSLVEAAYQHIRESATPEQQVWRQLRGQLTLVAEHARDARFRNALRKELAALDQGSPRRS